MCLTKYTGKHSDVKSYLDFLMKAYLKQDSSTLELLKEYGIY